MGAISSASNVSPDLCSSRLEVVFAHCFSQRDNSALAGGFDEPLYEPALKKGRMHLLRYREDFFASALHEVAHWCIAGPARRLQTDFGYWYAPDGRNQAQQKAFEEVEYKPQALEWFFAKACGYDFRVSADNLDGAGGKTSSDNAFERRVIAQAQYWCAEGLPTDAAVFFRALCAEFDTSGDLNTLTFSLAELK